MDIIYKERIWWKSGNDGIYTYYAPPTPLEKLVKIYFRDIDPRVLKIELYRVDGERCWTPLLRYDKENQGGY